MGDNSRCLAAAALLRRSIIAHTTASPGGIITCMQNDGLTNNSQLPASTVQGTNSSTSPHRCHHARPSPLAPVGETQAVQQSTPEIHGLLPTPSCTPGFQGGGSHRSRGSAATARRPREVWFSYFGNSQLTAVLKDTVLPSVSPSRRWKSPSTPDTSAPSAERPPSSVTPSVSGTASLASAPLRKLKFSSPLASEHVTVMGICWG